MFDCHLRELDGRSVLLCCRLFSLPSYEIKWKTWSIRPVSARYMRPVCRKDGVLFCWLSVVACAYRLLNGEMAFPPPPHSLVAFSLRQVDFCFQFELRTKMCVSTSFFSLRQCYAHNSENNLQKEKQKTYRYNVRKRLRRKPVSCDFATFSDVCTYKQKCIVLLKVQ